MSAAIQLNHVFDQSMKRRQTEPRRQGGSGDSDMWEYSMYADNDFLVNNLRQLADSVDRILADG